MTGKRKCSQQLQMKQPEQMPEETLVAPEIKDKKSKNEQDNTDFGIGIGKKIGDFIIKEKIGKGAMGIVYRAEQLSLHRQVALKILSPHLCNEDESLARFKREARILAQIPAHSHITSVIEAMDIQGIHYYAMEYVAGQSLEQNIASSGYLNQAHAADIVWQIANGIALVHKHGIMHRDIKPANVIVSNSLSKVDSGWLRYFSEMELATEQDQYRPIVKITDFGIATTTGEATLTATGDVLGTPKYMSPEQVSYAQYHSPLQDDEFDSYPGEIDARTDVYSLGVTLYQLLTGRTPFNGNPQMVLLKIMRDDPVAPRKIRRDLDRDLETIALKAMDKDQNRRYQTMQEFADDLERWLRKEPIRARSLSQMEKMQRWLYRHRHSIRAVAIAMLILVGAFGYFAWLQPYLRIRQDKQEIDKLYQQAQANFSVGKFKISKQICSAIQKGYSQYVAEIQKVVILANKAQRRQIEAQSQKLLRQARQAMSSKTKEGYRKCQSLCAKFLRKFSSYRGQYQIAFAEIHYIKAQVHRYLLEEEQYMAALVDSYHSNSQTEIGKKAFCELGKFLLSRKDYVRARGIFKKLWQQFPEWNRQAVLYDLAQTLQWSGEIGQAVTIYDKLARIAPLPNEYTPSLLKALYPIQHFATEMQSFTVGDPDHDGHKEILGFTGNDLIWQSYRHHSWTEEFRQTIVSKELGLLSSCFCLDIDGDGLDEIALWVGTGISGSLRLYKYHSGQLQQYFCDDEIYEQVTQLVMADVDGKPGRELVIGMEDAQRNVCIYTANDNDDQPFRKFTLTQSHCQLAEKVINKADKRYRTLALYQPKLNISDSLITALAYGQLGACDNVLLSSLVQQNITYLLLSYADTRRQIHLERLPANVDSQGNPLYLSAELHDIDQDNDNELLLLVAEEKRHSLIVCGTGTLPAEHGLLMNGNWQLRSRNMGSMALIRLKQISDIMALGLYEQAIKRLDLYIEQYRKRSLVSEALFYKAACAESLERYSLAIKTYARIIGQYPQYQIRAHKERIRIFVRCYRWQEAIEELGSLLASQALSPAEQQQLTARLQVISAIKNLRPIWEQNFDSEQQLPNNSPQQLAIIEVEGNQRLKLFSFSNDRRVIQLGSFNYNKGPLQLEFDLKVDIPKWNSGFSIGMISENALDEYRCGKMPQQSHLQIDINFGSSKKNPHFYIHCSLRNDDQYELCTYQQSLAQFPYIKQWLRARVCYFPKLQLLALQIYDRNSQRLVYEQRLEQFAAYLNRGHYLLAIFQPLRQHALACPSVIEIDNVRCYALPEYVQVVTAEPQLPGEYFSRAGAKFMSGDYTGSIADYETVLQDYSPEAVTNYVRCKLYSQIARYYLSREEIKELPPQFTIDFPMLTVRDFYLRQGCAAMAARNWQQALNFFTTTLHHFGSHFVRYYFESLIYQAYAHQHNQESLRAKQRVEIAVNNAFLQQLPDVIAATRSWLPSSPQVRKEMLQTLTYEFLSTMKDILSAEKLCMDATVSRQMQFMERALIELLSQPDLQQNSATLLVSLWQQRGFWYLQQAKYQNNASLYAQSIYCYQQATSFFANADVPRQKQHQIHYLLTEAKRLYSTHNAVSEN